ncbi:putative LRR containing protein [Trachipleistophora hominis]|uniref:Putative LRR containing protein n=1 Tax=Trachipleistophora hominis TaxID=72359 RepID=L7JSN4_TRAHO|nr:putative LRR containing protein [Trachipleistophora hominis]
MNYVHFVIRIPVTQHLFMKVIRLNSHGKVEFSDNEFYNTIKHLIMFVDNSSFILHLLVEKLIKNSRLWDRLKKIDKKNNNKSKTDAISYNQFEMNLSNAMMEINNTTYLAVMDNQKNVAFISENSSTRAKTPVYVNLRNLDALFLRPFIVMNGYFLINNHKELYKKYNKSIIEHGLNIEVDFC